MVSKFNCNKENPVNKVLSFFKNIFSFKKKQNVVAKDFIKTDEFKNILKEAFLIPEFRDLVKEVVFTQEVIHSCIDDYMERLSLEEKMEIYFDRLMSRWNLESKVQEQIFTAQFRYFVLDSLIDHMVERLNQNRDDERVYKYNTIPRN